MNWTRPKGWVPTVGLAVAMLGCKTPEESVADPQRSWLDYRPPSEALVYCVDSRGAPAGLLDAAAAHASSVKAGLMGFVVIEDSRIRCVPDDDVGDRQTALDAFREGRGNAWRDEEDALASGFRRALIMANRTPTVKRRILYIGNGRLDGGMSSDGILMRTASRNFARVPIDCLADDPGIMRRENVSLVLRTARMSGGVLVLDLDG